jgi:hypothetical protein
LRVVVKLGTREKMDVLMYEGNFNVEGFIKWLISLDKYFDYEDIHDEKKVKDEVRILKGHENLWWDKLQVDMRKGKSKIKNLNRMVAKLKDKFILKDYQLNLLRKL